jgi:hypothetical protein
VVVIRRADAPGFTAECFEGGRAADLLGTYPSRAVDIERLSVPEDVPADMPLGFSPEPSL